MPKPEATIDAPPSAAAGTDSAAQRLLAGPVTVINVGLEGFAKELAAAGCAVQHVDWAPPAGGDPRLADLLAKLEA